MVSGSVRRAGHQSRPHDDLDIMLPSRTRPLLVKHLHGRGFTECPQMTNVSGTSCSVIPNTVGSTSTYSSSPQTIALCIARERSIGISQLLNLLRRVRSQDARSVAFLQSTRCDRFVIEVVVPQLQRLAQGECLVRHDPSEGHWGVDDYDIATQGLVSCHTRIRKDIRRCHLCRSDTSGPPNSI